MATRESLAIREELAQARIAKATELIAAQTGVTIPQIQATEKDPAARNASLAEQTADVLESMVKIVTPKVDPNKEPDQERKQEPDQEPNNGDNNTTTGGDTAPQSVTEPIKRSTTNRKR